MTPTTLQITSVTPNVVTIEVGNPDANSITIKGFLFTTDNTVKVGPVLLTQIPSGRNGQTIKLVLPDRVWAGGEAPPQLWTPGTYPVSVMNTNGQSNIVEIEIR